MDIGMPFTTELIEYDGWMPPSRPQSPSSCFRTEDMSPLFPDFLHHSIPTTPRYTGIVMLFEVVTQDMPAQQMTASQFTPHLDLISPLSTSWHRTLQDFETTGIWEQGINSKSVALEGISIPGPARGSLSLDVQVNAGDAFKEKFVWGKPREKPAKLQQGDLTTRNSRENEHHMSGRELAPEKGALFPDEIKVLEALPRRHICEHPECNRKSYSRYEHLKRHQNEQVKHSNDPAEWQCDFCETPKTFRRCDNFRKHLSRHINNSARSRTKYATNAVTLLKQMQKGGRRRKRRQHKVFNN